MPKPRQRDGRWQARAHIGAGRYKTATFDTYEHARIWTNRMEADHSRGLVVADHITFDTAAADWLTSRRGIKQSSKDSYQRGINHLNRLWEGRRVDTIKAGDVEDAISRLAHDAGLSGQTLRTQIRPVLLGVFTRCRRDGYMVHDPTVGVEWPNGAKTPDHRYLTQEEVDMVAEQLDEPYRAMLILFAYTGLRLGELQALEGSDVRDGRLSITKALNADRVIDSPKNSFSVREVPLAGRAMQAIPHVDPKPLWNVAGRVPDRNTIRRRFNNAADKAGVERFRIHDLRHTNASWLIGAGANVVHVARWLGHAKVTLTLNTYAHLMPDELDGLAGML